MDVQGLNARTDLVNPSHHLGKVSGRAKKRIARLRKRVSLVAYPPTQNDDLTLAWAAIECHNLWSGFLRAYYLSGAIRTRTRAGIVVKFNSMTFPTADSAVRFAIQTLRKPKFIPIKPSRLDEPPWHDTGNFLQLHKVVGASNLLQIYAAFAGGSTFAKLLKDIRNFYAHRCDETFRKAAAVGVTLGLATKPTLRASSIMSSRLPKRPQNVIMDWLDDMENVVDLLCS
jgi:hypothetical protein